MRVAFIHQENAFLPELEAYRDFLSTRGIECISINPSNINITSADVHWHFMGTAFKRRNSVTIHEYTSASVPPFASFKDLAKKILNSKPDYRLFLNQWVSERFQFRDNVPFGFRDMGVSMSDLKGDAEVQKQFDFIYAGELAGRNIQSILQLFADGNLSNHSILILSKNYSELKEQFRAYNNIRFEGPVKHAEVKNFLLQSRFGLNLIPDRRPFNQQTSTKLLEYAAAKIPIISSEYDWVKRFQQQYGGQYYFIKDDLSNFKWADINSFSYSWPNLSEWIWEYQIRSSGVLEFLQSKFPSLILTSSATFGRILQ